MIVCRQCKERYEGAEPSFCGRCGADLRRASRPVNAAIDEGALALSLEDGSGPGDPVDPMIGRVIAGRYRVLDRIGSGGMGVVYKVEHTAMGKLAALKMLHPALSSEREVVKRFRTEARAVSLLTHPNTVQVFDFGEADGCLFMVMEMVRGEDLAAIVEREGPMPWRRAAPLLLQICEALAEAHEAGIIHRDVKPENVLVSRSREGRESVKVLDFGLAKLRQHSELSNITGRGTVLGTPYYMSPEQIRGEELDPRSDLYSLGALAYDLLTGEHPFDGPTPVQVLTAHLTETLVLPSKRRPKLDIDRRIEAIIVRCLQRDPAARYASADDLRRAIETLIEQSGPVRRLVVAEITGPARVAPPSSVAPQLSREDFDRFERAIKRRRWTGLSLLGLVLLGSLGAGAFFIRRAGVDVPVTEEVEPNNEPAQANLIAEGQSVPGHIGKRLDVEASDRDFFHIKVPKGPVVAHVGVSGIPNMQLHLSVFDRLGDKLGETDSGGPGDPEVLPNLRLDAGDHFVEVREEWVAGGMATENVTDPYSLRVTWHEIGDEEAEPDDTPATALPVPLGRPYLGYLGRVGDVDFYYPRGQPGGVIDGRVSGIPGVDLRLVALPPASPGAAPSLAGGDLATALAAAPGARVFDVGGAGAAEEWSGVPWPASGGAPLLVVIRKEPKEAVGSREAGHVRRAGAPGLDVPYTLLINRRAPR